MESDYLVAYDLDATLLDGDCVFEIFRSFGEDSYRYKKAEKLWGQHVNGEIDFRTYLIKASELLEGVDVSYAEKIVGDIPFYDDAEDFISYVKEIGYEQRIISHSPGNIVKYQGERIGIQGYGVEMLLEDNIYTGEIDYGNEITGLLVDEDKSAVIRTISDGHKIIAFGNGGNDYEMLVDADFGFAIHANKYLLEKIKPVDNIYIINSFDDARDILVELGVFPMEIR